jgi:hypothetical protein
MRLLGGCPEDFDPVRQAPGALCRFAQVFRMAEHGGVSAEQIESCRAPYDGD